MKNLLLNKNLILNPLSSEKFQVKKKRKIYTTFFRLPILCFLLIS